MGDDIIDVIHWLTMTTTSDDDSKDPANLQPVVVSMATVEKLLHHAAFAAHLVGHLDDDAQPALIRQLGDSVDTIAHELAELLGDPHALTGPDGAAPDDRKVRDGALVLTSIAGGAP